MALPDIDSGVGHSFGLELDGVQIKGIIEVLGLKMEQDVVELKENGPDGKISVRKLPGRWKSPDITLTRALTTDAAFQTWVKQAQGGKDGVRKNGSISVFDFEGALVKKYLFTNAWPKSLEIGALQAGGPSVLSEQLVLVCESLQPE